MRGRRYVMGGEPEKALNIIYEVLKWKHGYSLEHLDDETVMAEKGSRGQMWVETIFTF